MTALEQFGMWVVIVCTPPVLVMAAFGLAWQIRKWKAHHVAASPQLEAHDEGTDREAADHGDAAAALHRLPACGDDRDALADRAPGAGVAGRADHDPELWPVAHLVPVVQASLQPVGGWHARRAQDERAARRHAPSGARTPALVRAIESWSVAGVVAGGRPLGRATALRRAIESKSEAF